MIATPHKDASPELAWGHANWRLAWLLEDDEADRRTRVGRRHRQRRRLTRTTRAHPRQATHE